MRKLLIILAIVFLVIAIVFTVLPLGTLPIIPVGLAFVSALIAMLKSDGKQRNLPKWLVVISVLTLLTVMGKEVFSKDVVVQDKQFIKTKEQSKQEAKKDLEDLENLK